MIAPASRALLDARRARFYDGKSSRVVNGYRLAANMLCGM